MLATIYSSDKIVTTGSVALVIGLHQNSKPSKKEKDEMRIQSSSNKSEGTSQLVAPITVQKLDVVILVDNLCFFYFPYVRDAIKSYICVMKVNDERFSYSEEVSIY